MKSWLESKAIRYLFFTWLGGLLLQHVVPMLQNHAIDWWALGAQGAITLSAILVRMAQDDVQAPIAILNKDPK